MRGAQSRCSRSQFRLDSLVDQRAIHGDGHGLDHFVQRTVDEIASDQIEIATQPGGENIHIHTDGALAPLQLALVDPVAGHLDDARVRRCLNIFVSKVDAPVPAGKFLTLG